MKSVWVVVGIMILVSMLYAVQALNPLPPPEPKITIYLKKSGVNYTGIDKLTYHCVKDHYSGTANKTIDISCNNGVCTNSNWFAMGATCSSSDGYFTYKLSGVEKKTKTKEFLEGVHHQLDLNVDTGTFTKHTPSNQTGGGGTKNLCSGAFILLILFCCVVFLRNS